MKEEVKIKEEVKVEIAEKPPYVSPCIIAQNIELEYGIATGSIQNGMTDSWETNKQGKDVEW